MEIEELLAQLKSTDRHATPEWRANLHYESVGKQAWGFRRAIVVRVDANPEHVFAVPQKLGQHEMKIDLSGEIQPRSKIYIEVQTYRIPLTEVDIKTTAQVVLEKGGDVVFNEKYSSAPIWYRKTSEEIDT